MPAYLVTLNREKSGKILPEGADAMIVFAADATEAKEICATKYHEKGGMWVSTNSTATEVVADGDWVGWTFRVSIGSGFGVGADEAATFEFVGDATDDTVDEIGAALVVLLNAHADIAAATYTGATNVLEVTGVADAFGDQKLIVEIIPPGASEGVPSLVGVIVDEGIAAAVLSVVLPADAAVIPIVAAAVKQV